jgi:hypothetical protein
LVHRGQRVGVTPALGGEAVFAESVGGGAAIRAVVAEPEAAAFDGGEGSFPVAAAPLLGASCAAEAVIGFPQSMQNREVASFSRPQKEQAVNRHPPGREKLMAREYRNNQPPREDRLYLYEGRRRGSNRKGANRKRANRKERAENYEPRGAS